MNTLYRFMYRYHPDPDKAIWIHIDSISGWYTKYHFDEFTYPGKIRGGEWKRVRSRKLKDTLQYKTMHQRFIQGLDWEHTALFKERYLKSLSKGRKARGYHTLEETLKHYKKSYDQLYHDIKNNGYRELPNQNQIDRLHVHIYKNGEIKWTLDGNHRLSILYVSGIKRIPVYVWMRHREWQKKKETILDSIQNRKRIPENLKKYINHPDIQPELDRLKLRVE